MRKNDLTKGKNSDLYHLKFTGEYNFREAITEFDEIHNYFDTYKFKKLLIDISEIDGNIPIIDRFNLGEIFVQKFISLDKAAIISNEQLVAPEKFFQTVTRNRGANVQVFLSEEDAKEWIDE